MENNQANPKKPGKEKHIQTMFTRGPIIINSVRENKLYKQKKQTNERIQTSSKILIETMDKKNKCSIQLILYVIFVFIQEIYFCYFKFCFFFLIVT